MYSILLDVMMGKRFLEYRLEVSVHIKCYV